MFSQDKIAYNTLTSHPSQVLKHPMNEHSINKEFLQDTSELLC